MRRVGRLIFRRRLRRRRRWWRRRRRRLLLLLARNGLRLFFGWLWLLRRWVIPRSEALRKGNELLERGPVQRALLLESRLSAARGEQSLELIVGDPVAVVAVALQILCQAGDVQLGELGADWWQGRRRRGGAKRVRGGVRSWEM